MPGKKLFEAMNKAVKQKSDERKKKKFLKDKQTRIEDLYKITHKVKDVVLPYPNALVYDVMNNYFDGIENMDPEKNIDVGVMVWLLENQKDATIIDLEKEIIRKNGAEVLTKIPQDSIINYIICIDELFEAVKKKVSTSNLKMMTQMMESLVGEDFVSALPKDLVEKLNIITSK